MRYYVGAYAAAPAPDPWDPAPEAAYYAELRRLGFIAGLELPFYGGEGQVHAHDPAALLGQTHPRWDYVLTCMPGTMSALGQDPAFGLASESGAGRQAALEFAQRARVTVSQLNARLGRSAVKMVEVHSAPRQGVSGVSASLSALTASLKELRDWDWGGAELALEHSDRWVRGRAPAKGFLSMEEEIAAVQASGLGRTPMGMLINWGRSAIEGRSAETPREHVKLAVKAGLLRGLIYSGATAQDPLYGEWQDTHAPFAPAFGLERGAANSLLTWEQGARCLWEASWPGLFVLGFKVQPLPATLGVRERVDLLRDTASMMDHCVAKVEASAIG